MPLNLECNTILAQAGGVLIPDPTIKKEYDLVYSNQGGEWNDFARNWTLAKASMINLIKELNFKVGIGFQRLHRLILLLLLLDACRVMEGVLP